MYRKLFSVFFIVLLVVIGCSKGNASIEEGPIKVGIRSSELRTWEYLEERAKEEGLDIELVHFSSTYDPNEALLDGEIDVNAFQHVAFLDTFNEKTASDIVPIGTTIIAPLGIYSSKYESIEEIPEGSQIAIPNDSSNLGRALLLLQEAGLITVKDDFDGLGGEDKVKDNPKKLELIPMDSFNTPRAMEDTGVSVIGNGIAVEAGLTLKDALLHESETAKPYINIIAAKSEHKENEKLKQLVALYQTDETKKFIEETYDGNYIPTFITLEELSTYKKTYSSK
ncbi:MetQ/NlpA family ABC transporter substrate-binding protein [Pseudogracilibacillus auburnensis]|uniref:Lipoprotein n=1 Tax=Pseudogracilibacillus auburnensis TaxID=1494959 RepID=A0A2V3W0Q1_9BACI|nr:MetQ/NlpA family ABC transporter substrate-binding protein [Pseudogracilibacillus auburnensis]PXW87877.1 D-methionine transport system substrate-binding protein [Pseudogracilibacillus auburnensis]